MAVEIVKHLDNAETAVQDITGQLAITSKYLVSGLAGQGLLLSSVVARAVKHQSIPKIGTPHEYDGAIIVLRKSGSSLNGDQVEVTVEWGVPATGDGGPVVDPPNSAGVFIGSTLQQVTTEKDIEGRPIRVQHVFNDPAAGASVTRHQGAEITTQVPMATIRFQWREWIHGGVVMNKAVNAVGKTNLGVWPERTHEDHSKEGMWLCTSVEGASDDNGASYIISVEFQKAPKMSKVTIPAFRMSGDPNAEPSAITLTEVQITDGVWDGYAVFIDESTGRPPSGLDAPAGGTGHEVIPTEVVLFEKISFRDELGIW